MYHSPRMGFKPARMSSAQTTAKPSPRAGVCICVSPELRLVTAAANGDDDAYVRWIEQLRPQLIRYACERLGGDRAEAEDVVQDAAMRALLALRDGRVPANPRAWMYVIVRNRCHDVRGARKPVEPLDDAYDISATTPGPEERVAARRQLDAVVDALGELPESQRRAFISATFEGRPYEEIAVRESTSVQAVKSLVHRARRGLEASGARAAALSPALLALRARLRGLAAGGDGLRDQLAAAVSQHTAAFASVAAVSVAAVPIASSVEHHGHAVHRAPPVHVATMRHLVPASAAVHRAAAPPAPAAALPAKTRNSVDAVVAACESGASLDPYALSAVLGAQRRQAASDAEYGSGCSQRLVARAVRG
jgi:RNA polymerase sigma factor (sigma-70 family)